MIGWQNWDESEPLFSVGLPNILRGVEVNCEGLPFPSPQTGLVLPLQSRGRLPQTTDFGSHQRWANCLLYCVFIITWHFASATKKSLDSLTGLEDLSADNKSPEGACGGPTLTRFWSLLTGILTKLFVNRNHKKTANWLARLSSHWVFSMQWNYIL